MVKKDTVVDKKMFIEGGWKQTASYWGVRILGGWKKP